MKTIAESPTHPQPAADEQRPSADKRQSISDTLIGLCGWFKPITAMTPAVAP